MELLSGFWRHIHEDSESELKSVWPLMVVDTMGGFSWGLRREIWISNM